MTPPYLYRWALAPLVLVIYPSAFAIKVCCWAIWWTWEDVDVGGRRIL